jgi:hypothetical protein
VRTSPAHLESKLRFWDLSVGQIAAAFAGIMLGVAWAKFLSPLHGMWGAMSGAYIAALPVVPVFVASQTELDLSGLLVGAIRWRRLEGRYLPGGGETAQGYLLFGEHAETAPGDGAEMLEVELQALWDEAPANTSAPAGSSGVLVARTAHAGDNDHIPGGADRRSPISNGRKKR